MKLAVIAVAAMGFTGAVSAAPHEALARRGSGARPTAVPAAGAPAARRQPPSRRGPPAHPLLIDFQSWPYHGCAAPCTVPVSPVSPVAIVPGGSCTRYGASPGST